MSQISNAPPEQSQRQRALATPTTPATAPAPATASAPASTSPAVALASASPSKLPNGILHPSGAGNAPAICPTDHESVTPARQGRKTKIDKQSAEYIIKSGIAGGLAGCAAKTVVGPLDRVKILFQTSNPQFAKYTGSWLGVFTAMRNINQQAGMRGLFRGHSATLLRIFPYAGIKFLAYEQVRAVVIRDQSQETAGRRFVSGSIAGTISVFFTYPLEVVRVRLAFQTTRDARYGLREICKQIYGERAPAPRAVDLKSSVLPAPAAAAAGDAVNAVQQTLAPRGGLANFYRGFTPTLWGMLPYAGTSFLTHDYAQDLFRHPSIARWTTLPGTGEGARPAQLTTWAQLVAGGVAGFVSQTASYPLEIIRRRMQVGGVVGDGRRVSMGEVARTIWAERGVRGFFVGLTIGYVKVVPMVATSFYVYERMKYTMGI